MKITDVTTFLVHPGRAKNLCFVKIDTDEGIYGWGECYTQSDRDIQITAHVDQLKRYLIGRDPSGRWVLEVVKYDGSPIDASGFDPSWLEDILLIIEYRGKAHYGN